MHYYICLGDKTTGGGTVIEGHNSFITLGRPTSSMGMQVQCCNAVQTILQGWNGLLINGASVAYHGCMLTCGCTLVSSQNLMGWTDNSGGEVETLIPEQITEKPQQYRGRFTIKDSEDNPRADVKYRMESEDGTVMEGLTNEQGQTQCLWTHTPQQVSLELLDDETQVDHGKYHIPQV